MLYFTIFRLDWPYDWEDLMPELIERIKYDPQNRALLSMHHVVKSLAGKRLFDSIRLFQDASSQLFPIFYSHWEQRTDAFIKEVNSINKFLTMYYKFNTICFLYVYRWNMEMHHLQ